MKYLDGLSTVFVSRFEIAAPTSDYSRFYKKKTLKQDDLNSVLKNLYDSYVATGDSYSANHREYKAFYKDISPLLKAGGFAHQGLIRDINTQTQDRTNVRVVAYVAKKYAQEEAAKKASLQALYAAFYQARITNAQRQGLIADRLKELVLYAGQYDFENAKKYLVTLLTDKNIKQWHRTILRQFKKVMKAQDGISRTNAYADFMATADGEMKNKIDAFDQLQAQAEESAKWDEARRAVVIAFIAIEACMMINELISDLKAGREEEDGDDFEVFGDGGALADDLTLFLINLGIGVIFAIILVRHLFKTHHKYFVEYHLDLLENDTLPKQTQYVKARLNYPLIMISLLHGVAFLLLANFTSNRFYDNDLIDITESNPLVFAFLMVCAVALVYLSMKMDKVTEVRRLKREDNQKLVDYSYDNDILDWPDSLPEIKTELAEEAALTLTF